MTDISILLQLEGKIESSGPPTSSCSWDWLTVQGVKYCGTVPNNTEIIINVSGSSSISMGFTSDHIIAGKGFNIYFEFESDYFEEIYKFAQL